MKRIFIRLYICDNAYEKDVEIVAGMNDTENDAEAASTQRPLNDIAF